MINSMTDHHLNQLGFNSQHKAAFWQLVGAPTTTTTTQTSNIATSTTQTIGHANEVATAPTINTTVVTTTTTTTNTGAAATASNQVNSSTLKAPIADRTSYLKNRKIVCLPKSESLRLSALPRPSV